MSFIGSFAKGEWGKGLAGMFGGSIGETIFETARGNQTIGKAAAQIGTDVASAAISFVPGIGPVAGAQGALSIASMAMGAKQANAANEVSKQSLLFQKQTYNEQQAEIEKNKEQRRADALTDYNAASLFGSQLYGSESNNTLLTNYHTNNGTGNQGSFSLLNASISTSKRTDLT